MPNPAFTDTVMNILTKNADVDGLNISLPFYVCCLLLCHSYFHLSVSCCFRLASHVHAIFVCMLFLSSRCLAWCCCVLAVQCLCVRLHGIRVMLCHVACCPMLCLFWLSVCSGCVELTFFHECCFPFNFGYSLSPFSSGALRFARPPLWIRNCSCWPALLNKGLIIRKTLHGTYMFCGV